MSFIVLAVAAAHALPPIVGAAISKSESGVIAGAVVGGIVAIVFGGAAYVVPDLMGVGLGVWVGLSMVKPAQNSA